MKLNLNKKNLAMLALCIVALGLFIYIWCEFTFNFVALFSFLILFMCVPFCLSGPKLLERRNPQTLKVTRSFAPDRNFNDFKPKLLILVMSILVFGAMALYALGNYCNPEKAIYQNYDHHALKVEGLKIGEGFTLAGTNQDAFLDNSSIRGSVKIASFDKDSVYLDLKGFTNPIYRRHYSNDELTYSCLNKHALVSFQSGDWVTLNGYGTDDSRRSIKFSLVEGHKNGLLGRHTDTLRCYFVEQGSNDTIESSFTRFIKSGYPLEGIAADVPTKQNLQGINIVRGSVYPHSKRSNTKALYKDVKYYIELESDAMLESVQVNDNEPVSIREMSALKSVVSLPYKSGFFIGTGEDVSETVCFNRHEKDSALTVTYHLAKYQRLSSTENAKENTLMVTTSIVNPDNQDEGKSGLLENLTDNVLWFNVFHEDNNKCNINPFFVSYVAGPTNEMMEFSLMTEDSPSTMYGIKADTYFTGVNSRSGNEWLVKVENFKDKTPFKSTKLAWILLAVILASALSLLYSESIYTGFEYVCYLLIIAFLTIRFFLLWRITVFPPLSSITHFEFNHFMNTKWLNITIIGLVFFFVVTNTVKRVILKQKCAPDNIMDALRMNKLFNFVCRIGEVIFRMLWNCAIFLPRQIVSLYYKLVTLSATKRGLRLRKQNEDSMSPRAERIVGSIFLMLFMGILAALAAKVSGSPVRTVLGSVGLYLLTDGLIYWAFGNSYLEELDKLKNGSGFAPAVGSRADAFLLSLCNMLIITGVTLIADSGYGVMFSLFMLFSLWMKITDLYQYTRYTMKGGDSRKTFWPFIAFVALFVIIGWIIVKYKSIFLKLFEFVMDGRAWVFFLLAGLVVCLIALFVALILDIKFRKSHLIIPAVVFGFCAAASAFAPDYLRGSHMEYRTRVHMEEAGEILFNIENSSQQNKFLQASLNDWILYEYQNVGKDIKSFGESGNGYFKLQPQSKLGAMWFAQTTDICVSRYVIAEHGGVLPWLFVIAFAMMLLMALMTPSTSRWARMITVQIALLFAVQSLMILLANTRGFIFFGQDFPLISLTSRLSSLYFFVLFAIAVCTSLIGRNKHFYEVERRKDGYEMYAKLHEKNKALSFNMIFFFVVSAIMLACLGKNESINLGKGKSKKADVQVNDYQLNFEGVSYYKDGMYDVDTLLTVVNKELETYINPAFIKYQKKNGIVPLTRNMSDYVVKVFEDSLMTDANDLCTPYTKHLLDLYKNSTSKENSIKNLICLRNVRTYEYKRVKSGRNGASSFKVIPHDTLEFVTSLDYYKYELPKKVKNVWHGDVIESTFDVLPDSAYIKNSSNWACAFIPAKYTVANKDVQLMRATAGSPLKLVGSDAIISVKRDSLNVANVSSDDFVMVGNRTITDTPLQKYRYFAKNILLNGKSTYIYPNGHKMLWARDIVASKLRNANKSQGADKIALEQDMVITIDTRLNNSLYDKYVEVTNGLRVDDVARDRAVVVADGDGKIKAMVDYRSDRRYRINPNDFERIAELADSLYMNREKGRTIENRFFGNFSGNILRRGPGSTQKPIVWSAVTSMYNIGWWDKMRLSKVWSIDEYTKTGSYFTFNKYAGQPIESKFRSIAKDEGNGTEVVTLQSYMYNSSNYYNSLLAYIGSFRGSVLGQDGFLKSSGSKDGNTLFYKVSFPKMPVRKKDQTAESFKKEMDKYAQQYVKTFPGIQKGGGGTMSFNKFLTPDMALDTEALLPKGLNENFGLMPKVGNEKLSSCFNMSVRNRNETRNGVTRNAISNRQLNEYMVRSVAIGSNTIWNVTPLKMAEMFGRLISLNQDYELSYEVKEKKDYKMFNLDNTWVDGYRSYQPVRAELLKGMSSVFDKGTAKNVFANINKTLAMDSAGRPVKICIDTESGQKAFYIYGKTGTINGFWGAENKEDHMLATIITDREVSTCSEKDLKDMKFYVIYQVDYANAGGWSKINAAIIQTVLDSKAFRDYMGL